MPRPYIEALLHSCAKEFLNGGFAKPARDCVHQHWHIRAAELADQAGEAGGVVEVAMAADDDFDVRRILIQAVQVVGAAAGRDSGVEQQTAHPAALADLHKRGEPLLGQRGIGRLAPSAPGHPASEPAGLPSP